MCESAWSSPTHSAVANVSKKRTFLDKARSGAARRGSKAGIQEVQNLQEVPGRGTHRVGWSRDPKGTQQVPKNPVAREGREIDL